MNFNKNVSQLILVILFISLTTSTTAADGMDDSAAERRALVN
jgi:hypothetical protein